MSGSNSSNPDSAAPEPLAFTVYDLPAPQLPDERRTRVGRLKMLLVLAVCAAPVLASYFTYFVIRPQGQARHATLVQPPRPLPTDLKLTTLDGRSVDPASLRDQWLLMVVAGGACDAGCEQRLYLQRQLREMTGRERDRIDKVWLIDDDEPLRPEVLAAMQAVPAVTMLRAPRAGLQRWLQSEPGSTLDAHLYVIDPMGQWMMRTPAAPDPQQFKRDLDRLLRASASWDRAGR